MEGGRGSRQKAVGRTGPHMLDGHLKELWGRGGQVRSANLAQFALHACLSLVFSRTRGSRRAGVLPVGTQDLVPHSHLMVIGCKAQPHLLLPTPVRARA